MTEQPKATEPKPQSLLDKRREQRERMRADARELHEAYLEGESFDGLSPVAHMQRTLTMLGLDPGLGIEGTQMRTACGLEPLDVCQLAIDGTLAARIEKSRDEVAHQTIKNQEKAERDALKKKQSDKRRAIGARS